MTHPAIAPTFQARADAAGLTLHAAGAELIDELEPLWLALFDHQREVMDVTLPVIDRADSWPRRKQRYAELLTDADAFVLLVRRDAQPIAYAMVYLRPGYDDTWATGAKIAELESLAVLASERGLGVGTLLLDIVDQHLHEADVNDVRLSVTVGNNQTLNFYRKRGLVPTLTVMGRHDRH